VLSGQEIETEANGKKPIIVHGNFLIKVNKARFNLKKIAELVKEKKIEGNFSLT